MNAGTSSVLLVAVVAVGAAGAFLRLRNAADGRGEGWRQLGGVLAGFSLLALLALYGMPAESWPESRLTPTVAFAAWILLAVASLAAAFVAITAPTLRTASFACTVLLAANAGLYVFQAQYTLAAATGGLCAAGIAVVVQRPWPAIERRVSRSSIAPTHQLLLASAAAGLLVIGLIASIRLTLAAPIAETQDATVAGRPAGLLDWPRGAHSSWEAGSAANALVSAFQTHPLALLLLAVMSIAAAVGCGIVIRGHIAISGERGGPQTTIGKPADRRRPSEGTPARLS